MSNDPQVIYDAISAELARRTEARVKAEGLDPAARYSTGLHSKYDDQYVTFTATLPDGQKIVKRSDSQSLDMRAEALRDLAGELDIEIPD